jgi:hypothetical protein
LAEEQEAIADADGLFEDVKEEDQLVRVLLLTLYVLSETTARLENDNGNGNLDLKG